MECLPSLSPSLPLSSTWHHFSASLNQTFSLLLSPFPVIPLSGLGSALAHTLVPLSLPSASLHHLLYLHHYLKVLMKSTLGFVPYAAAAPGIIIFPRLSIISWHTVPMHCWTTAIPFCCCKHSFLHNDEILNVKIVLYALIFLCVLNSSL